MNHTLWYALPLVVSVSLVYAATRHEDVATIFRHAFRVALWITGVMALILLLLFLMSRQVS